MTTTTPKSRGPKSVPPAVEYHRVLAGEERRIGRGILAIVLLLAGLFGGIQLFYTIGAWVDGLIQLDGAAATHGLTPVAFASSLAATALLTPWSMLIQRWLYGVRGASLHSVASRFRFELFGKALLAILPLFVIAFAITEYLEPRGTMTWSHTEMITLFVVVMLLVPLQAAGEEYGLRGLVFRIAGSWARGRWVSLILGMAVSTAVFSAIHLASDPWWSVFYVVFSLSAAIVTWRTGGIEIAVVSHAVINVLNFLYWFVLQADIVERMDRSAGAVSPALVIPSTVAFIVITAVVWLRTRRTGPAKTPSA